MASLKGVEINERYIKLVENQIIMEFRKERKLTAPDAIDTKDMEIGWNLLLRS
jgi:hypothetical protein